MRPVRTVQRYRCEHAPCKKTSIKWRMEKHEKQCYFNPERTCPDERCMGGIIPASYMEYAEHNCELCKIWKDVQKSLSANELE